MRDTNKTRRHYAEVAANWINEGARATLLEFKRHARSIAPAHKWAIRTSSGELAEIDAEMFLDLIEAPRATTDGLKLYTPTDRLRHSGLTVYYHGDGGLTILNKRNPLLTK